jgi:hypothetical protein
MMTLSCGDDTPTQTNNSALVVRAGSVAEIRFDLAQSPSRSRSATFVLASEGDGSPLWVLGEGPPPTAEKFTGSVNASSIALPSPEVQLLIPESLTAGGYTICDASDEGLCVRIEVP